MLTIWSSSTQKCFASFRSVLTSIIRHLQTIPVCLVQCIYTFTIHLHSKFNSTTFSGSFSSQTEGKLTHLYHHYILTLRSQKHPRQVAQIEVLFTI
jgi:hypothetical protein